MANKKIYMLMVVYGYFAFLCREIIDEKKKIITAPVLIKELHVLSDALMAKVN